MSTTMPRPALDAPTDDWLVYADTLQQAGDPRGELIVLHHEVEKGGRPKKRDGFIAEHAAMLLGPAARHQEVYRLTWKWCLIEAAELRVDGDSVGEAEAALTALFAAPAAESLHSLTLTGVVDRGEEPIDLSAAVAALATAWPASCKSLRLIDQRAEKCTRLVSRDWEPGENLVRFGELGAVLALPGLESLHITTADPHALRLGAPDDPDDQIKAPDLRHFTLHGLRYAEAYGNEPLDLSTDLAQASWPHLESFDLRIPETWVASYVEDSDAYHTPYSDMDIAPDHHDELDDGDNEGVNWSRELGPLLASLSSLPLKRLALTSFDSADTLVQALVSHGLPATLEELDLSQSSLSSREVATLLGHRQLLGNLKTLDIRQTRVSKKNAEKLAEIIPEVRHSSGGGAVHRYIVGME